MVNIPPKDKRISGTFAIYQKIQNHKIHTEAIS